MGGFGAFAAFSQFYLYGRRHCTRTGYERAKRAFTDDLSALDLTGKVFMITGANSGVGFEVAPPPKKAHDG